VSELACGSGPTGSIPQVPVLLADNGRGPEGERERSSLRRAGGRMRREKMKRRVEEERHTRSAREQVYSGIAGC